MCSVQSLGRYPHYLDCAQVRQHRLPPVASSVDIKKKKCAWMCGHAFGDFDEINGCPLKWAYADGSGESCWECERVWQTKICHVTKDRNRQAHQARMAKNKVLFDGFRSAQKEFRERRKGGYQRQRRGFASVVHDWDHWYSCTWVVSPASAQ